MLERTMKLAFQHLIIGEAQQVSDHLLEAVIRDMFRPTNVDNAVLIFVL